MEELFRSLSESVSEECYNEILGIVEELIDEERLPGESDSDMKARMTNELISKYQARLNNTASKTKHFDRAVKSANKKLLKVAHSNLRNKLNALDKVENVEKAARDNNDKIISQVVALDRLKEIKNNATKRK